MAAKLRELLNLQVLARLKLHELSLVDLSKEQIVGVSLVIQSKIKHLFTTDLILGKPISAQIISVN